ncbi:MAG: deoxyribose-phosphate aldolase [bacterium]|jgi:deoxyribose-phosphate aldolase
MRKEFSELKSSPSLLAKYIDHSILHPTATDKDLEQACSIAKKYNTASICVKPYMVEKAVELLEGSTVKISTVIGFPHGSTTRDLKVIETIEACRNGASEIDMVINIGKVIEGDWDYVEEEIGQVMDAALEHNAIVKVIFENDFLKDEHKIRLCQICSSLHVAFVKTSTGFGFVKQQDGSFNSTGATIIDIQLMRKNCDPHVQIKAAGGLRNLNDVLAAIEAGATRIGTSATIAILEECKGSSSKSESISGNY